MAENSTVKKQNPGQLNSVQLNIVSVVDIHKAVATGTLKNTIYMMDNSVGGSGQGTGHLQTICKQGQVINFILYGMDMEKRPDGTWPPMAKINNIVFLDDEKGDEDDVDETKVMTEFKIYGGPDMMRSPYTPIYYYWAGTVLPTLPIGEYHYRFVLELEKEVEGKKEKEKVYLNTVDKPSLKVISV